MNTDIFTPDLQTSRLIRPVSSCYVSATGYNYDRSNQKCGMFPFIIFGLHTVAIKKKVKQTTRAGIGFQERLWKVSNDLSELAEKNEKVSPQQRHTLEEIAHLDLQLSNKFKDRFQVETFLTRQIVSYQANKTRTCYRWYKFKEAFSASLVEYLLGRYGLRSGKILDPFAGSGTALFAASALGIDADGIELLPVCQQIIMARCCLERQFTARDVDSLKRWRKARPWKNSKTRYSLPKLRITDKAYPGKTVDAIEKFLGASQSENQRVQMVLRFALLCVLESISYTRKDGQYLRWDHRSGRRMLASSFNKGPILEFEQAICKKIGEIILDIQSTGELPGLHPVVSVPGRTKIFPGSCLNVMPDLPNDSYLAVITSPPYCNRYDYTRTYALEIALLGIGEKEICDLRQQMLSCTVENRAKDLVTMNSKWERAVDIVDNQKLLQSILLYLERQKVQGKLNNNGIPRMVRGYFYEMACVIYECSRVMMSGAPLLMVNDNVRYAGASISVDLILSDIAQGLGFHVENILVLPTGKGNSSQQMGQHGRVPLRKCVYVWRKV